MAGIIANIRNTRAIRKYGEFVGAMDQVEVAFDSIMKVIDKVDDTIAHTGFTLPTQDELKAMHGKAFGALDSVRQEAKKHEGDLVSRDWMV
ncbi:hypothetical protein ACWGE0_31710 [Lentzea sp. NPDC054927]